MIYSILTVRMDTKNIKLLMLLELVVKLLEVVFAALETNSPIFKIAFADSSSNAKSKLLIKLFIEKKPL